MFLLGYLYGKLNRFYFSIAIYLRPVDTARQEKKKTATIMKEPRDGLIEKQNHGNRQRALSCVDPDDDDNNNNDNNNFIPV